MTNETELMPDVIFVRKANTAEGYVLDAEEQDCSTGKNKLTKYIRADLAVPEGHALVPLEHTQAMTDAVKNHIEHIGHAGCSILTMGWYKAMIAAAQKGGE